MFFDFFLRIFEYFMGYSVNLLPNFDVVVTNTGDREVQDLVKRINNNRDAMQTLRIYTSTGKLDFIGKSGSAMIFVVDGCEVLKFFKNTYCAKLQSDIEYGAYCDLQHLPNIPQVAGFNIHGDIRYIAMDYCGVDGMDLLSRRMITYKMWKKAVFDLGECLDDIHALNRVHGDIKIENITWDYDQWFFIDFGFGYSDKVNKGGFHGTFPNILPAYGLPDKESHPVMKLRTYERRKFADYYAFALSMLSLMAIDLYDGDESVLTDVAVGRLYRIHRSGFIDLYNVMGFFGTGLSEEERDEGLLIVRTLAEIALTQLDHTREKLVWNPGARTCEYQGENVGYKDSVLKIPNSIADAWSKIYKLKLKLK
jgi:serine/threonine protein kinase